jgi:spore maturation protein SpmA
MPHPGTKAYLDDDTKTLLETYSDHIWLALFGFSLIGSSVTGLLVWTGLRKPSESAGLLHGLPTLIDRVSSARTVSEVNAVQEQFDGIVAMSLREYASGALGEGDSDRPVWLAQMQSLIEHQLNRVEKSQANE